MKISRSLMVLFFCFISVTVIAQNNRRFRHLDINNGLAHTDALCTEQDQKGFIWIGTNSGLQRFDGRQLKTFLNKTSVPRTVYNNRVTALLIQNDYLWIGTEGGLNCFNLRTEKYLPIKVSGSLPGSEEGLISRIVASGDDIWVISSNNLYRCLFDSSSLTVKFQNPVEIIEKLPDNFNEAEQLSLASGKRGIIWTGSDRGLAVIIAKDDGYLYKAIPENKADATSLAFERIEEIVPGEDELWLRSGSMIQILSLEKSNSGVKTSLKTLDIGILSDDPRLHNATFSKFVIDNDDNLWLASNIGLLYIKNPKSEVPSIQISRNSKYDQYSLGGDNISGLFIDRSNCLWISSWGGGASYIDLEQKKFNLLVENPDLYPSSLKGSFVRSIAEDKIGLIWIGMRNSGMNIFNPKTGKCITIDEHYPGMVPLTSNEIRSLKFRDDEAFIGTIYGLNVVNLNTHSVLKVLPGPGVNGISDFPIFSIEIDRLGQIWTSTWGGGINRINLSNSKTEVLKINENSQPFSLSSDIVPFLLYDESKNELFASTSRGLNRIILDSLGNISEIVYYRLTDKPNSLSSEYLWPIVKENDSVFWIGTLGGGLNRLSISNNWDSLGIGEYNATSYSVKSGDQGNDIESILQDGKGNLWIGGRGISRFNISTSEFWNFDVNDGLQSNGFKIGSACKCSDGTLYFGGVNGLNYFKPEEIKENSVKPMVALTDLKIHNQIIPNREVVNNRILLQEAIQYTKSIILQHIENDFSISFASLHFANPEKCRYRYILEGYDINWNYISGDYPVANYSNLDYGDYIFKVDATNCDGLWNGDPEILNISILPPWWRTNLAYSIYLLMFVLAVYGFYYNISRWIKLRNNLKLAEAEEKRKEELHQMKLQFFTNISHEFKTPLTLIISPAEKLINEKNSEHEQRKLLTLVMNNANRLLHLVNELMDFRKAEMGKLTMESQLTNFTAFSFDVYQQFIPLSKEKNITFNFLRSAESKIWFDAEMMAKILFNLFSNAVKYTDNSGTINANIFEGSIDDIKPYYINHYEIVTDKNIREFSFIRVHDSGIGISEGSIGHIFDRFYQVNKSSDRHLGTGIGLALLKSLVMLHHGYILVSSERFEGTEIILGFPLGDQHFSAEEKISDTTLKPDIYSGISIPNETFSESEPVNDPEIHPALDCSTLLIVEDNDDLRKILVDHFSYKYIVYEAEDGQKGFDIALKEIPSLIISDVMMPGMNGFEMVTLLKEDIHTCHIPVVFLTAKSSIESQIEGVDLGAVEYISKPFNIRLLDAKIRQLTENLKKLKEKYASDVFAPTRDFVRNKKDQKFIDDLYVMIDANLDNDDFSVDEICRQTGFGRSNLYKKIKSLTDQSLGEFIRTYRLKKAAKILLTEDVTVSEVIYRVGMSSHSYFTKTFKSQFNMTPSEFVQKKIQGKGKTNKTDIL